MIAVLELGLGQLALAAALILLNAAASFVLRLGIGRRVLWAAVRSVVQLAILAVVLEWVFGLTGGGAVLGLLVFMALYAGFEAVRRTGHRAPGVYPLSMGVMLVTGMLVALYGLAAVVRVEPWYTPQYAIPILGMILGNMLNGITLGLDATLSGFRAERERVELLLAHGATRREASRDVVRAAVRTGMIPVLNMMTVAGIISIPGMMTGQILAGSSPADAARYQIFILFSIAGAVAVGTVAIALLSARLVFDDRDRLRVERIRRVN